MKTIIKIIVIACVMMVSTINTFAQVTASANATATIVATLEIEKESDMDFGNLSVNSVGGTCILSTASVRTPTVGVTLPSNVGTVTAAEFTVTGDPTYVYSIILPLTDLTISNTTTPGFTMIVNAFNSDPTVAAGGVIGSGGTQTLYVGATVIVEGDQEPGVYVSGTPFDVTVNYN